MRTILVVLFAASATVGFSFLQSSDAVNEQAGPSDDQFTSVIPVSPTPAPAKVQTKGFTSPTLKAGQPDPKKTAAMRGWMKSEMGALTRQLATATKAPAENRDEQIKALMAAFKARAEAAYRKHE